MIKTSWKFNVFAICGVLAVLCLIDVEAAHALRVKEEQVILDELSDYELCQRKDYTGDWCHDALKRWVKEHPSDAFKAGKMTRRAMNHWVAVPFFAQAFDKKAGDCADKDVQLAVVSALDQPVHEDRSLLDQAKKIGFSTCFPQMKDAIVQSASIGSYAFKNVCKELAAKDLLTGLKKAKCQEEKQ